MASDPTSRARYATIIEGALRQMPLRPWGTSGEGADAGLVYAQTLLDLPTELGADPPCGAVVDGEGHSRHHYRGLLYCAVFQAARLSAAVDEAATPWRRQFERAWATVETVDGASPIPASIGASASDTVWMALAARAAADGTRADAIVQSIVERQTPAGPFLAAGRSDNPETHWYHELVILHAVASYAALTNDRRSFVAAARAAQFHQNETQPDHATNQPWALFAFLMKPITLPLADQILHAAMTLGDASPITSILLADALYCLRASPPPP